MLGGVLLEDKNYKLNIDRTLPNGQPARINNNTENLLPHDLWHKLYTKEDLENAVTAINWHSDENRNAIIDNAESKKEEIITSVVANKEDAVVRITASVKTESEKAKERLEQIRLELIEAINKTGQLVELGFGNLNEQIIDSKDEIISEVKNNSGFLEYGARNKDGVYRVCFNDELFKLETSALATNDCGLLSAARKLIELKVSVQR